MGLGLSRANSQETLVAESLPDDEYVIIELPDNAKDPSRSVREVPCSIVRWSETRGSFIGRTSLRGTKDAVLLLGQNETQILEAEEANLQDHFTKCRKYHDHENFIPIDNFTPSHLPSHLPLKNSEWQLYDVVKSLADLTVRVGVKTVSRERPQFWPGTGIRYPFFGMTGREFLRTGSGRITSATKFSGGHTQPGATNWLEHTRCPCPRCERAGGGGGGGASDEWWEVSVLTATHVIFDDAEARGSHCRLFYDSEASPVTALDCGRVDRVIVDEDTCLVKYFTCDMELGRKLEGMVKRFNQVLQKVTERHFRFRDEFRLVFIVSHPHGLSKHVSVGRWKDKCPVGDVKGLTRFTYTTSTCQGSSGAQVLFVGYTSEYWRFQHVHCGTLDSVVNFSGTGYILTSAT